MVIDDCAPVADDVVNTVSVPMRVNDEVRSGHAGSLTRLCATSTRNPSTTKYAATWLGKAAGIALGGHDTITHRDAVVSGDFNIAPDDRDVWSPEMHEGKTHVSSAERDRLAALHRWGLCDVFREHHADGGLYSWWDYRAGAFHKRRGMRIDLLLATRPVADDVAWVVVHRNERKGPKTDPPSEAYSCRMRWDCPTLVLPHVCSVALLGRSMQTIWD